MQAFDIISERKQRFNRDWNKYKSLYNGAHLLKIM